VRENLSQPCSERHEWRPQTAEPSERHEWRPQTAEPSHPPRHPQFVDTKMESYPTDYAPSYDINRSQPGPCHQSYTDSRSYPPAPRWEPPRHPRSQGQYVDTEGHNYSNEYGSSRYGDIGPQPGPTHQSYTDSRSYPPAPRWEEEPRHPRRQGHHNYLESHPNYQEFNHNHGYRERYPEYSSHSYQAPR